MLISGREPVTIRDTEHHENMPAAPDAVSDVRVVAINMIVLLLTPVASGTVATGPGQAALCRPAAKA